MVQTRAVIEANDGALSQDTAVKPFPILDDVPQPVKNRRGGEESQQGNPGKPCRLNFDVLFLIAAYLHPEDLLKLARTCKSLRQFLMDSTFVWKAARSTCGMPDCPPDLSEPEYANLACCPRCHACGIYTEEVLWHMRRRYCSDCKDRRLYPLSSCHEVIRTHNVLATETLRIEWEWTDWVDEDQVDSFMHEYNHSSDKERFLHDKHCHVVAVRKHANDCILWYRRDWKIRQEERERCIFERLKQHGYEPEIIFYQCFKITYSLESFLMTSKPLTDEEWTQMRPGLLDAMDDLRIERLECLLYRPRRERLLEEYRNYVKDPPPNPPVTDFLPHPGDLLCLPSFQDIIKAPEGTEISFESMVPRLPVLVDQWRKEFDTEIAELVKIPANSSFENASRRHIAAPGKTTCVESSQTTTDKLRLACAVFGVQVDISDSVFIYPEVLNAIGCWDREAIPKDGLIRSRFHIRHLDDAPYIVHACGLDPNVATAEDMDRRNARLKCLSCQPVRIRSWRDAMWHANSCHSSRNVPHCNPARWEIISDDYMDEVQAIERSVKKELEPEFTRCLLCLPRVGDSTSLNGICRHLELSHGVCYSEATLGVHYMNLEMHEKCSMEMQIEGGQVTFKDPIFAVIPR